MKKIINIFLIGVLIWVLYQRIPQWVSMYRAQGGATPHISMKTLQGQMLDLPLPRKHLLVFWYTWCAPCKVELARINHMIEKKQIRADDVVAVAVDEESAVVEKVVRERGYLFPVVRDEMGKLSQAHELVGTPLVILVTETGKVHWKTTGLSPSLEVRVRSFF